MTKATRYMRPYQRTDSGPTWMATGSNWGWMSMGSAGSAIDYTRGRPRAEPLGNLRVAHAVEDDPGSPFQQRRLAYAVVEARLGHHRRHSRGLLRAEVSRAGAVVVARRC